MPNLSFPDEQLTKTAPKQTRGQKTLDKLLDCAQDLLVEGGFEALNSNAVVQRAGMTPPAFYRYFKNKHDVLRILCERLMVLQNEALNDDENWKRLTNGDFAGSALQTLRVTLDVTQKFKAGPVLLQLLRAIPELKPIRLDSHNFVAGIMADHMYTGDSEDVRHAFEARSRLSVEIGYSVIEMLFETDIKDKDVILKRTSVAMTALFADLSDSLPIND